MSWAQRAKQTLRRGQRAQVRPRGHSMRGKVESGNLVTLAPITRALELKAGDIVLVRVRGTDYLHLIKAVNGRRFLIGNNRGGTNGWVGPAAIYGIAVHIED